MSELTNDEIIAKLTTIEKRIRELMNEIDQIIKDEPEA